MKKEYNVAELGGKLVNKTVIGKELTDFKNLEIDLRANEHKEIAVHLQKYGAYTGDYKNEGSIVIVPDGCDLVTDHKYKWTDKGFMPLGHGYGKPKSLPNGVNKEQAIYLMMKAVTTEKPIPQECKDWVLWYEDNLKKRNEEHIKAGGIR